MITNGCVVLPGESAGLSPGGLDAAARTGAAPPAGSSVTFDWAPRSAASANAGSLCGRSPWAHRHSPAHSGSGARSCRGPRESGLKVRG